jgi:hypothetical protein
MKKLTGNTEIEDSLSRLDKLTQEEARMASAELLKVTHSVDNKVTGVDDRVKNVEGKVQDVRGDVQRVGDKLDQANRSLSLLRPIIPSTQTDPQGTTSEIVFYDGYRPQIHPSTITSHAKLITTVQLNGFFKAVYSINGNPPTPSYGYAESVRYS